jgi:LysM repeat protein
VRLWRASRVVLTRPQPRTGSGKCFLSKGEDALFTRLKRYAYAPIAALALWAVLLAAWPATANAQETSPAKDPQVTKHDAGAAERVVVAPGDCLWSISERQLGPNATPQQIASEVERIYALNRDQITDPNLIFAGQRLLLPPVGGAQSTTEPHPTVRPTTREVTQPAQTGTTRRAAKSETGRALSTAVGEAGTKAGQAPDPVAEPVALPDMPTKQLTPKVGSPSVTQSTSSPVESFGRSARSLLSWAASAVVGLFPQDERLLERRLLGWGIIVLTLIVCGLMAWRLPMRRNVGGWRIPKGRVTYYTYTAEANDHYEGTPGGWAPPESPIAEQPDPGSFGDGAPALENGLDNVGMMKPTPLEKPQRRAVSEHSGNRSNPSDGVVRRYTGFTAIPSRNHRTMHRRKQRDDEIQVHRAPQGWEISEPLRRSLKGFPLQPGAARQALPELKPQVEGALRTLALLERGRYLSEREYRQESALRDLLVLIEETLGEERRA